MSGRLDGRVAVITGAGKGIGEAIARRFAKEGATVVVSDLDEASAQRVASDVGGTAVACDVREDAQVAALVKTAVEQHGKLDVAVANAGVGIVKPVVESSYEDWRAVTSVNLDGVFSTLRHAGLQMAGNGGGSLVTIASVTGFAGSPLISSYAAAKAGAINLTKTTAVELRDLGVRANAICPGFIDTDLVKDRKSQFEEGLELDDFDAVIEQKQGRYGTPEEVAALAVFLASDRSAFCTGSAFVLDGGLTASLL
ncbi:SDR family NAD(P)-dependent oxidoreductase [Conexibacter sp. SYSU D00693]|uniref:SDR family NAD(P)-dependent oxidoreductase n=1 Tax=Conexibacter sp. SYSU D00693 TaxID=2812560 RepID=UPI00196B40D2|nr:glucose 1-dehydrogenase [Conexibacter sp. SYSU D00693]